MSDLDIINNARKKSLTMPPPHFKDLRAANRRIELLSRCLESVVAECDEARSLMACVLREADARIANDPEWWAQADLVHAFLARTPSPSAAIRARTTAPASETEKDATTRHFRGCEWLNGGLKCTCPSAPVAAREPEPVMVAAMVCPHTPGYACSRCRPGQVREAHGFAGPATTKNGEGHE